MSKTAHWPAWYFGPNGQRGIFDRAEDVPEGWEDTPAAFPEVADTSEGETSDGGEIAHLTGLVAALQAEHEKLVEGLAALGYGANAAPEGATPVDFVLTLLRGADEMAVDPPSADPDEPDAEGARGGLRGERREIMERLTAAGIKFSPTMKTDELRALLP